MPIDTARHRASVEKDEAVALIYWQVMSLRTPPIPALAARTPKAYLACEPPLCDRTGLMPIVIHHFASATRAFSRFVTCEKCGCEFTFKVTGSATGIGRETFGTGDEAQDARDDAVRKANEQAGSVVTACPDCGWYNAFMVKMLRRDHLKLLRFAGFGLLAAGAYLVFGSCAGFKLSVLNEIAPYGAAASMVAGVIVLLVQRWKVNRYNPNADWPKPPVPWHGPATCRTPEFEERLAAQRAVSTSVAWYYMTESGPHGPVSFQQLLALRRHGSLGPLSQVWAEGLEEWCPAMMWVR